MKRPSGTLLLPQALVAPGRPEGARALEHLHHEHQQDDTHDHDVGLVAVIAVGQGDLAQPPPPMTPDMAE